MNYFYNLNTGSKTESTQIQKVWNENRVLHKYKNVNSIWNFIFQAKKTVQFCHIVLENLTNSPGPAGLGTWLIGLLCVNNSQLDS